jgi:peptide/nickel transport system substrate-binding protein
MKRRSLLAGSAAGIATLAAPRIGSSQSLKIVKFVPQADLALLDPVQTTASVTRNHGYLVFDTLYGMDENLQPQPQMVDGHSTTDDGKTWELTLRDGLKFHDGEPVRATDVVASIGRWSVPDPLGSMLMAQTDELSAPNDRVVRFRLKKSFPLLPQILGKIQPTMLCIMPERLAKTDPSVQVTEMVGSGPFRFLAAERVSGARAVYEKFTGYVPRPGGVPGLTSGPKIVNIDRVEWQTIPEPATAAAALLSGSVDWWERPNYDLLPMLRKNPNITAFLNDRTGEFAYLRLNHLQPPFDNPAIRRAVLGAIDQTDMMLAVAGTDQTYWKAGVGVFPPGSPMANDAGLEVLTAPRDYEKVKRDILAAGYSGEKVALLVSTDVPDALACCQVTADAFKKVGLNVDYQASDWGTVAQRRTSKKPVQEGGWSCYIIPASGLALVDPSVSLPLRGNGANAPYGWPSSPRLEALRDAWMNAPDDAMRKQIAREMQLQAWQDVPFIPLGQYFLPTVFRTTITDVLPGYTKFWNLKKA